MRNTWFLGQSILIILAAFLLGLLVGWLWWGRQLRKVKVDESTSDRPAESAAAGAVEVPATPEPEPEPVRDPEPEPVPAVAAAAAPADDREDDREDDLKRIEGIGPKMARALNGAGIRTYEQLAASDVDRIRAAVEAAGLRFAPSLTTWARQARLLADGDEDGFADLRRRLVGGRDVGRA